MVEVIFWVRDKYAHDDPVLDAQTYKRGDVICSLPDGAIWGTKDKCQPEWRIVRLPDAAIPLVEILEAQEYETEPENPKSTLKLRAAHLDLDHPMWKWIAYLDDNSEEAQSVIVLNHPAQAIQATIRMKPAAVV